MKFTLAIYLLLFSASTVWSQTFMKVRQELDQLKVYESLAEALKNPEAVYRLNLSDREIDEEQLNQLLPKFGNLRELNLSNTFVSTLPKSIGQLQQLQFLDIQHLEKQNPNLSEIPESMQGLKTLVSVNLIGNPGISWSKAFLALSESPELLNLALMNNNLSRLPDEITQLHALEMIWLGRNPDLNLEDTFSKLSQLIKLKQMGLGGNGHTQLPPQVTWLKSINNLWLSGNPWENLDGLQHLPQLTQLSLHNCDLKVFPIEITSCKRLEYLSFVQNPSLNFDKVFDELPPSLRVLNLGRNQIKSLSTDQLEKTNLETLILSNNNISEEDTNRYQQANKDLEIIF